MSLDRPDHKIVDRTQMFDAENSVEFRLGPEHSPASAMRRSRSFVAMVLPALFVAAPNADAVGDTVLSVLTELIDITARHRASIDLGGRLSCDRAHVLIIVGEMDQPLPDPEEEPGLFLVRRLSDEIGQYRGDEAGYVTWVSVPVRVKAC